MKRKHYILVALCLLLPWIGRAQNKLFDKYAEMDGVTSVYISKSMFNMLPSVDVNVNLTNIKGKIDYLQLLSTEQKDKIEQMRKEFSTLATGKLQEFIRVHSDGTRINFYATVNGEKIENFIMLSDVDSVYTVIQLTGSFTLKEIQEIASGADK
ncbi:MAG: DUF4252 domain-containing protein [Tannerellaceae bacterium]|jgi:hypothetical protein|nr:DUF4252 domain-containing protein [Tannerellaceae bacterium]